MIEKIDKKELNPMFKAGLLLNIISCGICIFIDVAFVIAAFFVSVVFGGIIFLIMLIYLIGIIFTLIISLKVLKQKDDSKKVLCGVLGIVFGFLVGGILILVSPPNEDVKIDSINKATNN